MNALKLLENDHHAVEVLFGQIENTEDINRRKQIFQEIKSSLERHAKMEEEVFYPRLAKEDELRDDVKHAVEEHQEVKSMLQEMSNPDIQEDEFNKMLYQLMDDVNHHVEEEEYDLFPRVESILGEKELKKLGEEMTNLTLRELQ